MTQTTIKGPVTGDLALNYVYDSTTDSWNPQVGGGTGTSASQTQGTAADGAAAVGNPVQVGGVDGSGNVQALAVDTTGRTVVVGAAADGAAASGNPVLVSGIDGSNNTQTIATDTSGRVAMVGAAADGAAAAGNPVLVAGMDGSNNAQTLATDTSGNQIAVGNVASGATDSGNPVKVGGLYSSTLPTLTNGQRGNLQLSPKGMLLVAGDTNAIADGSANIIASLPDLSGAIRPFGSYPFAFNGSTWDRMAKASATSRIVSSAASTNATSAKASAGTVYGITGYNSNAAVRYLKLYNKASAPTVGTDTPVLTYAIPPTAGFAFDDVNGMYFSTGIAYALTTGSADADTGAVGAADIVGLNIKYS